MRKDWEPEPAFYMNNDCGGGDLKTGGDGGDLTLAENFRIALRWQAGGTSSTAQAGKLVERAGAIYDRIKEVSGCLFLLDRPLQPYAERLNKIEYRDREVPGIIVEAFEGFKL